MRAGQGRRARRRRRRRPTAGEWVVNPSGGLISKGHPLGATGLAQCAELTWQLRGEADERQVDGATVGICSTTSASAAPPSSPMYRKDRRLMRLEDRVAIITGGRPRHRARARAAVRLAGRQGRRQRPRRRHRRLAAPTPRPPRRSSTRSSPPAARPSPPPTASARFDGAKAIVDPAVEAFGDLHVVVNNAGILRDRMLVSMTEQEFDDVIAVHLKGTFNVTRHAADVLARAGQGGRRRRRERSSTRLRRRPARQRRADQLRRRQGRHRRDDVVNGAELERYDVQGELHRPDRPHPPDLADAGHRRGDGQTAMFDPENISPLVAVLASADCPFNGQVFSVYGGGVGIYAGWSIAEEVDADGAYAWTVDELAVAMAKLPTPRQGQQPDGQMQRGRGAA